MKIFDIALQREKPLAKSVPVHGANLCEGCCVHFFHLTDRGGRAKVVAISRLLGVLEGSL